MEPLSLVMSYFTDQQNRVKFNGITGSWKDVIRGCPQGSSFGPLVWNIFQNVTLHMISGTKVITHGQHAST